MYVKKSSRITVLKEKVTFLENLGKQKARNHLEFLATQSNMLAVTFLKESLKHLEALNTEIQENWKVICILMQGVSFFCVNVFEIDIASQKFINFLTILEYNIILKYTCSNHQF